MVRTLPIVMPPIETYQSSSFILGIVLANDNIKNAYFNNYINLSCNNTSDIWNMNLRFVNDLWEDYRVAGLAEMDMYHLKNIAKENFGDFIKERIDQGNYLLLYYIDEYYLSYTENYMKKHFIHDTYIYGYSTDLFYIMAYKDNKLQTCEILIEEIVSGIYAYMDVDKDANFCSFRPFHAIHVEIDCMKIKNEIRNYVKGYQLNSDGIISGIGIYDILMCCLRSKIDSYEHNKLDLRVFRLLWEHKKVLIDHIKEIINSKNCKEVCIDKMEYIERNANKVFMLAIKYNMIYDKKILYNMLCYIDEMKRGEKVALELFLETCWRV